MEQIYIYVGEDYGAEPYLTTLSLFRAELVQICKDEGLGSPPELTERRYAKHYPPCVQDDNGKTTLIPATLDNFELYSFNDPHGLLGWAIAQDLERLIRGHCGEGRGVGFGELRRAVEMVEEVTSGN